ncbi:MAG: cell division protein ZapA [Parvibaculales bacterium]
MGELNISINNRPFLISCADGEEPHVSRLAEELAARISSIKKNVGEVGDSRLLVLAGLTMCDEIKSLSDRLAALQRQIDTNTLSAADAGNQVRDIEASIAATLTEATQKLQNMSDLVPSPQDTE